MPSGFARQGILTLADLLDHVSDLVMMWSPDGRVLAVNRAVTQRFGFSASSALVPARYWLDLLAEDEHTRWLLQIEPELEAAGRWEGKLVMRLPSGSFLQIHATVLRTADIVSLVGQSIDTAPALPLEHLADSSPPLAAILDRTHYLSLSSGWEQTLGYSRRELLAQPFRDFLHPEDVPTLIGLRERLDQGHHHLELLNRHRHRNGQYRWLQWHSVYMPEQQCHFALVRDVTDERRTLRRLALAQHSNAIGTWTFDEGRSLLVGSEHFWRMLGLPASTGDMPLARCLEFLSTDEQRTLLRLARRSREQQTVQHERFFVSRVDGHRRCLLLYVHHDEGGFWGTIQDITAFVSQEQALIETRETALLASQAKSAFLANMSHEIRTPLNAVLGALDLLHGSLADSEHSELLEVARTSGRVLLELLNNVLDFSKIEADKLELECAPLSPARIAREAVNMVSGLAHDKGLMLTFSSTMAPDEHVLGDPLRLQQILLNLLSNAIKFTLRGGVDLALTTEPPGSFTLTVRDTGVGISPAQQKYIFEPFVQAASSTSRRFGGTGLGLAISRQLAQFMGGTLSLESQLGVGSTFRLQLPLDRYELPMSQRPAQAPLAPSDVPLRILLAEDNPVNVTILRRILERMGHSVVTARDGGEAVELARLNEHDLILMDLQMPVLDGVEATLAIRADPRIRRAPIIALTASTIKGDLERCLAAGMDHFLEKPVQIEQMRATLARFAAVISSSRPPSGVHTTSSLPPTRARS